MLPVVRASPNAAVAEGAQVAQRAETARPAQEVDGWMVGCRDPATQPREAEDARQARVSGPLLRDAERRARAHHTSPAGSWLARATRAPDMPTCSRRRRVGNVKLQKGASDACPPTRRACDVGVMCAAASSLAGSCGSHGTRDARELSARRVGSTCTVTWTPPSAHTKKPSLANAPIFLPATRVPAAANPNCRRD